MWTCDVHRTCDVQRTCGVQRRCDVQRTCGVKRTCVMFTHNEYSCVWTWDLSHNAWMCARLVWHMNMTQVSPIFTCHTCLAHIHASRDRSRVPGHYYIIGTGTPYYMEGTGTPYYTYTHSVMSHMSESRHILHRGYRESLSPGLPITDCTRGCNNRGHTRRTLSAIAVTEKTFFHSLSICIWF